MRQMSADVDVSVTDLDSRRNGADDAGPEAQAGAPAAAGLGQVELSPLRTEQSNVDTLLVELEALIGLSGVKQEVGMLVSLQLLSQRRAKAGLPAPPMSRHLVFAGPPGTGKTTHLRECRREHSIREIAVIDQRETLGHFRPCCGQWLLLYGEGATSKASALHGLPLAGRTRKSPRSMQPCLMAACPTWSGRRSSRSVLIMRKPAPCNESFADEVQSLIAKGQVSKGLAN